MASLNRMTLLGLTRVTRYVRTQKCNLWTVAKSLYFLLTRGFLADSSCGGCVVLWRISGEAGEGMGKPAMRHEVIPDTYLFRLYDHRLHDTHG